MSLAVIFSGQGSQHPSMLPWLTRDELVREMEALLQVLDWRQALADPVWAENNVHAQVLLTASSLAAWQQLLAHGLSAPMAVAGYSVGEVPAFCAAGVYQAPVALQLARMRAQAMSRCAEAAPGGLLAVTGLQQAQIATLCVDTGLTVAIHNGPDAFILGGLLQALATAEQKIAHLGARQQRLRVAVASHTPWMHEATEAFLAELQHVPCHRPRCVLLSNTTGDRVSSEDDARLVLAEQLRVPVRWSECMEILHARRVSCVLEIGPGHALARMWNERYPDVPARSCDDFRSVSAVVDWVSSWC